MRKNYLTQIKALKTGLFHYNGARGGKNFDQISFDEEIITYYIRLASSNLLLLAHAKDESLSVTLM